MGFRQMSAASAKSSVSAPLKSQPVSPVGFDVWEVSSEDLETTERYQVFGVRLQCGHTVRWSCLTKELSKKALVSSSFLASVFWLDPEREEIFDQVWRWQRNATKIKIVSGPQKGFVGYYSISEEVPH